MKIKITENANYSGRDMNWTEEMECKIITTDTKVFHCSDNFIAEFFPKETCFFVEEALAIGHVYEYTVKAGSKIYTDGSEIRIEINAGDEMLYTGEYKLISTGETKETYSNYEGWIKKQIMKRTKI